MAQVELRFFAADLFAPTRRVLPFLAAPLPALLFLAEPRFEALFRLVLFRAALFFAPLFAVLLFAALFFAVLRFAALFFALLFFAVVFALLFLALLFLAVLFAVLFLAVVFLAPLFLAALDRAPAFFAGTFAPDLRASDRPIAMACLRLSTVLPERPLFSVPRLRSSIAFPTLLAAFFPYLAMPSSFLSMHCDNARRFRKTRAQCTGASGATGRERLAPTRELQRAEGDSIHDKRTKRK